LIRFAGWHQSLSEYATKISDIVAKMFAILPNILPENRASVNQYVSAVYIDVTTLQNSMNTCQTNNALQARFQTYIEAREARLKSNLESVKYVIDAMDSLALVTGPGMIERVGVCLLTFSRDIMMIPLP
jgi:hypothetical protein